VQYYQSTTLATMTTTNNHIKILNSPRDVIFLL
jgi:hypothetical protein